MKIFKVALFIVLVGVLASVLYAATTKVDSLNTASTSAAYTRLAKAVSYSIATTDQYIAVTVTGKTMTLPAANSVAAGKFFLIKSVGAAVTTTVALTGGDTIDGIALSDTLGGNASNLYISDGVSNWEKN
jgi:hypothetical protein